MPKRKRVKLSDDAPADIESIGDYIATDSPRRARSYVRELRKACAELADMPERFAAAGESGLRRRPYGSYSIYYDVTDEHIFVLRVVSAARDVGDPLSQA